LFIEHPAVFNPARSPVYAVPTMRVDSRSTDFSPLIMSIDRIMGPRLALKRNGLAQVTSFAYRDEIVRRSDYRKYIVSHWDGSPVAEAVARYKAQGGVLASPSVMTGYNFPGDECRFNILTKIPFQPKTKVIRAREELDPLYGPAQAMRGMVQAFGRGDRSEEDWCENFLLDDHSKWFCTARYGFLAPNSFWPRFKWVNAAPPPLML